MGSNPATVYWMDRTFFHIDLFKLYYLFEKTENKLKRGRGWPIENNFYRFYDSLVFFDGNKDLEGGTN